MVMGMAEYKDITELKKQIADFKKAVHSPNGDYLTGYVCALSATEGIIAGLPDADVVEVVHGYWIGTRYDGYADGCPVYDLWECSECREEYESEGDPPPYNYCHNCGAKMDGDGNEILEI
jgi:hypothetical protein